MDSGKVREFGDAELQLEARKAAEQLFRIRFQMKLGQTEGVKRVRGLRKDIARLKTVERERLLGVRGAAPVLGASGSLPAASGRLIAGKSRGAALLGAGRPSTSKTLQADSKKEVS